MKKVITVLLTAIAVSCVSAQNEAESESQCPSNSEQRNITAYFEVPEFIETGLTDGSMERVGGVILLLEDQQVIAWVRKGGQMGQVVESGAGLLHQVSQLSGAGLTGLGRLAAGVTPLLNISMAGYSLIEHIAGVRAHEAELERIYDRVSEEFQRDREVKLATALEFAENTLLVDDAEYGRTATAQVNSDLMAARRQLTEDLANLYSAEMSTTNTELVLSNQALAMRVCLLGTRLLLDYGHEDAARDLLSTCVNEQETQTTRFVRKWLGSRRAFYFHESVSDEYFDQYIRIERWLRGKHDVLADIVRESRKDFWVHDALAPLDAPALFFQIDEDAFYKTALPSAELMIENLQRLQGMQLELQSMCVPTFAEWDAFEGDAGASISDHDGFVMLVNQALLEGDSQAGP